MGSYGLDGGTMLKHFSGVACVVAVGLGWTAVAHGATVTFAYNGTDGTDGSPQAWVVPAGVAEATFDLYGAAGGASGGASYGHAPGGAGAHLTATLPVTPGETLTIRVGGAAPGLGSQAGGYNGGGGGPFHGNEVGLLGGGGGASDVRRGADTLADRVLVAGGGGGGGSFGRGSGPSGAGGVAGGAGGQSGGAGVAGTDLSGSVTAGGGGQPGGSAAGGAGGVAGAGDVSSNDGMAGASGAFGAGAPGTYTGGIASAGGAGGGGWYGGGAGATGGVTLSALGAGAGGGGGGSSHADAAATNVSVVEAANAGQGSVVITYTPPPSPAPVVVGEAPAIATVDPVNSEPAGGDVVTISGGGFTDGAVVHFGDVVAATTVLRYDRLRVVVPPHAPGPVALSVVTATATSAPVLFTYLEPRPGPVAEVPSHPATAERAACVVPNLRGRSVAGARSTLAAAGCRLGHVRRTVSRHGGRRAHVIAQSRKAGTRTTAGTKVNVTTRRRR